MANSDEILQRIADKGMTITADDVRRIEFDLTQMPVDEANEAEPWIWEAVGLIVNDPIYGGDAKLPAA